MNIELYNKFISKKVNNHRAIRLLRCNNIWYLAKNNFDSLNLCHNVRLLAEVMHNYLVFLKTITNNIN